MNMKALLCSRFGPLEDLRVEDVPVPSCAQSQVVVRVQAASLNFPDVLIAQGLYQVRPMLPFSPGAELAGVVVRTGSKAAGWKEGDRVMASTGYGAFAQQCAVDAQRLVPLRDGLGFDQGAALVVAYGTSLHALKDCAQLRDGETVLVLGAAGGVGVAAIQIARKMGARVIAAVSTQEKAELCRRLGADEAVDYTVDGWRERVKALCGGEGVDIVYDPVGGAYAVQALRCLRWRGRYLTVGFAAGAIAQVPLNLALLKERRILGVYWGDAIKRDPATHQANMRLLQDWCVEGAIEPVISRRARLAEVPQAMRCMAGRQVVGKIIIRPQE